MRLPLTCLLGALLAVPALAQEKVEDFSGYDASLEGTTWLGIYLNGFKNVGSVKLEVTPAPEGSGATYRAVGTMTMQFGPMSMRGEETLLLGERLEIISSVSKEEQSQGERKKRVEKRLTQQDGKWVMERTEGEQQDRYELAIEGDNHESLFCGMLVLRKLDKSKGGTHVLKSADWPGGAGDDSQPSYKDITFTVPEASEAFSHRGKEVQAYPIKTDQKGEQSSVIVIGPENQVLAMWLEEGPPLKFVAGASEEEIKKDLQRPQAQSAGGPLAAVKVYFEVLAKSKDTDALDAVMDWAAIRDEMAKDRPEVGDLQPEFVASMLKDQFKSAKAPITPDQIDLMMAAVTVVEDGGETATINMPGAEGKPFKLRKDGERWLIVRFPH